MACAEPNQTRRGEPDTSGCESLPSICFYKPRDPTEILAIAEADTQTQLVPSSEPEPEPKQHSESLAFARKTPNCARAPTDPASEPYVARPSSSPSASPTPSLRPSARQHSTPIFPELLHSPSNTEVEAQHSSIRTWDVGLPIAPPASSLSLPLPLAWNERQTAVLDEHIARLGHFCAALDADADAVVQPSASVSVSACEHSRVSLQISIATQLGMGRAMDFICTNGLPTVLVPNSSIARTRTRTRTRAPAVPAPAPAPSPSSLSVHSSLDASESSSILSTDLLLLRQQFAQRICSSRGFAPAAAQKPRTATACSCCRSLGPDIDAAGPDADADNDSDATNSSFEMSQLAIKYLPDSELSRIASSMQASRPTRPSFSTTARLPQHSRLASHMSSGTDSCCSAVASPKSPCRTSCSGFSRLEQQRQHTLIRQCAFLKQERRLGTSGCAATIDFPSDVSLYGLDTTELSLCTVGYLQRYGLLPTASGSPSGRKILPRD